MTLKLGGTRLSFSYLLVAVMTVIILADRTGAVISCFAAALMHEAGHLYMLHRYGSPPENIRLSLFDIVITDRNKLLRPMRRELPVVLAGVTVNFVCALFCMILLRFFYHPLLYSFMTAHLTLGIFNSLPSASLDGGQALMLILSRRLSPAVSGRVLRVISFLLVIPGAVLGFFLILRTGSGYTMVFASLYLLFLNLPTVSAY